MRGSFYRPLEELVLSCEHPIRQNEDLHSAISPYQFRGQVSRTNSNLILVWTPSLLR